MFKYISSVFVVLALIFGATSCSNDFELTEPKVETPVVYALFNAEDEYHYLRLERVFADENIGALEIAKNPDSLYYKDAEVTIQVLKSDGQTVDRSIPMVLVDGNTIGEIRDTGIFATSPNYLYRIAESEIELESLEDIRVVIDLPNEKQITAKAKVIAKPVPSGIGDLKFVPDIKTFFSWRGGEGSLFHNVEIVFHITEQNGANVVKKDLNWRIVKDYDNAKNNNRQFTIDVLGLEFYSFMAANLDANGSVKRYMDGVDLIITSGGEDLYKYIKIGQANLGITSSGEVPFYTNLSEGRGVVSSRSVGGIYNLQLKGDTYTELRENTLTKDLNFQ